MHIPVPEKRTDSEKEEQGQLKLTKKVRERAQKTMQKDSSCKIITWDTEEKGARHYCS